MSDMPRPVPRPSAAAHEQHDPLLLAQFAAGDPLDATGQRQAQELVSGCVACASLVADLRAVSNAVAWEPLPPRRRDFRLDADEAERLSGNAFTRFLHRLSLPQARAFQPAAAGVLSIGLVFVVAGYAWPDGGTVSVGDEWSAAPAAIEEQAASTPATIEERAPAAATSEARRAARSPAVDAETGDASPVENPALSGAEAEFLEGLAEHQAGTSARKNAKKSLEAEMADDAEVVTGAADAFVTEAAPEEAFESDALDRNELAPTEPESAAEAAGKSSPVGSVPAEALGIENADVVEPKKGIADDDVLDAPAAVVEGVSEPDAQDQVVVAAPVDEGLALESLLVAIGFGLALLGAVLLLLAWLARRGTDPLLR